MDKMQNLIDGNIDSSDEGIVYWAKQINCSEQDLIDAVYNIGNRYNMLVMYLEMNHKIHKEEVFYIVDIPKKEDQ